MTVVNFPLAAREAYGYLSRFTLINVLLCRSRRKTVAKRLKITVAQDSGMEIESIMNVRLQIIVASFFCCCYVSISFCMF